MRRTLRAIAVTLLACVTFGMSEIRSHAQLGALTVGAFINSINDLARQVDESVQALLEQGNSALAQQQTIAAGILRQLVAQF